MIDNRPKTIICDIDGTLVEHRPQHEVSKPAHKMNILPGTIEKLSEWESIGCNIILITGRKESLRENTEKQLRECGVFYDQLIMGVGGGGRILINDKKSDGSESAWAFNTDRNVGIKNIQL
jgi:hydroxymethylpyrimidine pyrophosphatase-like HAD family hydrolase